MVAGAFAQRFGLEQGSRGPDGNPALVMTLRARSFHRTDHRKTCPAPCNSRTSKTQNVEYSALSSIAPDTIPVDEASKRTFSLTYRGFAHKTPSLTCSTLDQIVSEFLGTNAQLVFKCENFQKVGAFKFRGATNSIKSLLGQYEGTGKKPIVITHSSGNHAQALALAAREQGVTCHVVMPNNAPSVKKAAVRGYGALVTECEPTLQAREDTTAEVTKRLLAEDSNAVVEFISPYDDPRVIAGQGTLALELLEQAEELGKPLDVLITPVGGGGMLSGCAVAAKGTKPTIRVIGAEPEGQKITFFHILVNSKTHH